MRILSAEQRFLLDEARNVWEEMESAKHAKLPWQEETITDILLKNLKLGYPGQVEVIPFNKVLEAESGADWIWSFVSADSCQSITMLVQAKRLDDREVNYPKIDRKIGNRTPPVRQIDELIATATQFGVGALYAFYNHLSDVARVPHHCATLDSGDPDHIFGFGISLAEAELVLAELPDQCFDTHCQHSIPLHCLICSKGQGSYPTGGTPAAIVDALRRRREERRRAVAPDGSPPGAPPPDGAPVDLPPDDMRGFRSGGDHPIVQRAREGAAALEKGAPPSEFRLPDAAGLVVLRDVDRRITPDAFFQLRHDD